MRFLIHFAVLAGVCSAASAQPKLAGFPFQDETLRYTVRGPSGINLGQATFTAQHGQAGWSFETSIAAGVPGFSIDDAYKSRATDELCSLELERSFIHRSKKTGEKTIFDQRNRRAVRTTTLPADGGSSELDIPSCGRDAVAFVYFARREMGQGRVAPAQQVFFGAGYSVALRYTGESTVTIGKQTAVVDGLAVSVKGPRSEATAEVFFARDAARTPLLIRIPLSVGSLSAELVR